MCFPRDPKKYGCYLVFNCVLNTQQVPDRWMTDRQIGRCKIQVSHEIQSLGRLPPRLVKVELFYVLQVDEVTGQRQIHLFRIYVEHNGLGVVVPGNQPLDGGVGGGGGDALHRPVHPRPAGVHCGGGVHLCPRHRTFAGGGGNFP